MKDSCFLCLLIWVLLLAGVEYASSICGFLKVRDLFLYFRRPKDAPCSFRWACLVYNQKGWSFKKDVGPIPSQAGLMKAILTAFVWKLLFWVVGLLFVGQL